MPNKEVFFAGLFLPAVLTLYIFMSGILKYFADIVIGGPFDPVTARHFLPVTGVALFIALLVLALFFWRAEVSWKILADELETTRAVLKCACTQEGINEELKKLAVAYEGAAKKMKAYSVLALTGNDEKWELTNLKEEAERKKSEFEKARGVARALGFKVKESHRHYLPEPQLVKEKGISA